MFILTLPSIFIGFYCKDMFIGLGSNFWGNAIFTSTDNMNRVDSEFITHIYIILYKMTFTFVTCYIQLDESRNEPYFNHFYKLAEMNFPIILFLDKNHL